MATATYGTGTEQIGETAGLVWQELYAEGTLPLTKLVKRIDAPRDLTMQAIGWLAREGKVVIEDDRRKKVLSLRDNDT